jgi:hypothetical protein
MTELKIAKLVFFSLSIVPIKEALLNPESEFMKAALFLDSMLRISSPVKWIVGIEIDLILITTQQRFCLYDFLLQLSNREMRLRKDFDVGEIKY